MYIIHKFSGYCLIPLDPWLSWLHTFVDYDNAAIHSEFTKKNRKERGLIMFHSRCEENSQLVQLSKSLESYDCVNQRTRCQFSSTYFIIFKLLYILLIKYICLCVPKNLANRWTDRVLLYRHWSPEGKSSCLKGAIWDYYRFWFIHI